MKYVMSVEILESDRITYASQNGNREFFSLFIYICINNIALPSALIYKNNSKLLQDIWLKD